MESNSAEAQGTHDAALLLLRHPPQGETPLVKLTALSTVDNVRHILPGLADPLLEGDATVLSTTPEGEAPKDWLTGQAINPIETVAPIVPTMVLVIELTSPIIQRRKVVNAGCNCFSEEVEFGSNWSHPQGHSNCLGQRNDLPESPDGSTSAWTCWREKDD